MKAMILAAGLLLLTPGFFTDGVGFLLLIPPVRAMLIRWGAARMMSSGRVVFTTTGSPPPPHRQPPRDPGAVDGDYVVLDDDTEKPRPPGNSGWRRPD